MNTTQKILFATAILGSAAVGALTMKALELRSSIKKSEQKEQAWEALRDKMKAEKEAGDVDILYAFDEITRIGNI